MCCLLHCNALLKVTARRSVLFECGQSLLGEIYSFVVIGVDLDYLVILLILVALLERIATRSVGLMTAGRLQHAARASRPPVVLALSRLPVQVLVYRRPCQDHLKSDLQSSPLNVCLLTHNTQFL